MQKTTIRMSALQVLVALELLSLKEKKKVLSVSPTYTHTHTHLHYCVEVLFGNHVQLSITTKHLRKTHVVCYVPSLFVLFFLQKTMMRVGVLLQVLVPLERLPLKGDKTVPFCIPK